MSEHPQNAGRDPTADAADWAHKLSVGTSSVAERRQFVRWLKQSPINAREFLALAAVRALLRSSDVSSAALERERRNTVIAWPMQAIAKPATAVAEPRQRMLRPWMIAAASVVCAVIAGTIGYRMHEPSMEIHASTGRGEVKLLPLPDGTQLTLDTSTTIVAHFDRETRTIEIRDGRIHIDVAEDPRPLRVQSPDVIVRDIGTKFDVYVRAAATEVTVVDGSVEVQGRAGRMQNAKLGKGPVAVNLARGERALVDADGRFLNRAHAKPELSASWQAGRIEFDERPLGEIAAEFNRYNTLRLDIVPEAASLQFTGSFVATDAEAFVATLAHNSTLAIEWADPAHVVVRRRSPNDD